MSQHTERFLDGLTFVLILVSILSGVGVVITLVAFVHEHWHYVQWGVYALVAALIIYLLGWLIELTS